MEAIDCTRSETIEQSVDEQQISLDFALPIIAKSRRIIPNDLIRSSLFTVVNHNVKRDFFKNKQLYSLAKASITYTGEELRQDDEDVWMQIIFQVAENNEEYVEILPYRFLRQLGWPLRSQYRDKLKDCISRMSATNITLYNKHINEGITLSLIRKFVWQDEVGSGLKAWRIWIEPEIARLFAVNQYSKVVWDQRKALKPLAKWLYSYYSSHAQPLPIPVATLRCACGSKTKELKHFKSSLRSALLELVKIGFLEQYWIDARNFVCVIRKKQNHHYIEQAR